MSHHWIKFMKCITLCLYLINSKSHIICKCLDIFWICRHELMKRWIKISYSHWSSFKCLIHSLKVSFLEFSNRLKCFNSLLYCIRKNHSSELRYSVFTKEHMLCSAKSYAFCTELYRFLCILWCICIRSYTKLPVFISPAHKSFKITTYSCCNCLYITFIYLTS